MMTLACYLALAGLLTLSGAARLPVTLNTVRDEGRGFDYFMFVRQWPGNFCSKHACPLLHKRGYHFTIHGLWPNYNDGTWPQFCDSSYKFDESQLADLEEQLEDEWPSFYNSYDDFWEHEWSKHGTCALGVLPNEHKFFQTVLKLHLKYDLATALSDAKIMPSSDKLYRAKDLADAIEDAYDARPLVHCQGKQLAEIWMCFDKDLHPFDCDPSHERGNCDEVAIPPLSDDGGGEREDAGAAEARAQNGREAQPRRTQQNQQTAWGGPEEGGDVFTGYIEDYEQQRSTRQGGRARDGYELATREYEKEKDELELARGGDDWVLGSSASGDGGDRSLPVSDGLQLAGDDDAVQGDLYGASAVTVDTSSRESSDGDSLSGMAAVLASLHAVRARAAAQQLQGELMRELGDEGAAGAATAAAAAAAATITPSSLSGNRDDDSVLTHSAMSDSGSDLAAKVQALRDDVYDGAASEDSVYSLLEAKMHDDEAMGFLQHRQREQQARAEQQQQRDSGEAGDVFGDDDALASYTYMDWLPQPRNMEQSQEQRAQQQAELGPRVGVVPGEDLNEQGPVAEVASAGLSSSEQAREQQAGLAAALLLRRAQESVQRLLKLLASSISGGPGAGSAAGDGEVSNVQQGRPASGTSAKARRNYVWTSKLRRTEGAADGDNEDEGVDAVAIVTDGDAEVMWAVRGVVIVQPGSASSAGGGGLAAVSSGGTAPLWVILLVAVQLACVAVIGLALVVMLGMVVSGATYEGLMAREALAGAPTIDAAAVAAASVGKKAPLHPCWQVPAQGLKAGQGLWLQASMRADGPELAQPLLSGKDGSEAAPAAAGGETPGGAQAWSAGCRGGVVSSSGAQCAGETGVVIAAAVAAEQDGGPPGGDGRSGLVVLVVPVAGAVAVRTAQS